MIRKGVACRPEAVVNGLCGIRKERHKVCGAHRSSCMRFFFYEWYFIKKIYRKGGKTFFIRCFEDALVPGMSLSARTPLVTEGRSLESPQPPGRAENCRFFAYSSAFLYFLPLILVTRTGFETFLEVSTTCFEGTRSVYGQNLLSYKLAFALRMRCTF